MITQDEFQKRLNEKCHQDISVISEYKNKRSEVTIKCNDCGHIWNIVPHNNLYRSTKFYCPNCGEYTNKKQNYYFECAYCKKPIKRVKSDIDKNISGNFYCSIDCGNKYKNEIRKSNGEWDIIKDYRAKAFQEYKHKCMVCNWDEDERVLEVHHIDEDRENNAIDNLIILCPMCHRKLTSHHYVLTNEFKIIQID